MNAVRKTPRNVLSSSNQTLMVDMRLGYGVSIVKKPVPVSPAQTDTA